MLSFRDLTEPGVPALEGVSLVGDKLRARSNFSQVLVNTLHHSSAMKLQSIPDIL